MEIQWALVLFTVISGIGAWQFAASMLGYLLKKSALPNKAETIAAFVLLVIGGFMSVLHLKHVDRIFEALNHPTSGIFIEAALIGVTCVLVALYFVLLVRGSSEKACTAVGILAALVGIVFTYACGHSYMMEARPAWVTEALPLAYFGTAAASGTAFNLLMKAVQKADEPAIVFSGWATVGGAVLGAVISAAFCAFAGSYIASSELGAMTWAIALFVGAIVAIVGGIMAAKKPANAAAAGIIALVGGVVASLALRLVMWLIGTPFMDFFMMPLD